MSWHFIRFYLVCYFIFHTVFCYGMIMRFHYFCVMFLSHHLCNFATWIVWHSTKFVTFFQMKINNNLDSMIVRVYCFLFSMFYVTIVNIHLWKVFLGMFWQLARHLNRMSLVIFRLRDFLGLEVIMSKLKLF
jgi:hypothetical protein